MANVPCRVRCRAEFRRNCHLNLPRQENTLSRQCQSPRLMKLVLMYTIRAALLAGRHLLGALFRRFDRCRNSCGGLRSRLGSSPCRCRLRWGRLRDSLWSFRRCCLWSLYDCGCLLTGTCHWWCVRGGRLERRMLQLRPFPMLPILTGRVAFLFPQSVCPSLDPIFLGFRHYRLHSTERPNVCSAKKFHRPNEKLHPGQQSRAMNSKIGPGGYFLAIGGMFVAAGKERIQIKGTAI